MPILGTIDVYLDYYFVNLTALCVFDERQPVLGYGSSNSLWLPGDKHS